MFITSPEKPSNMIRIKFLTLSYRYVKVIFQNTLKNQKISKINRRLNAQESLDRRECKISEREIIKYS